MLKHSLLVLFLWILCPGNNRAEEQAQRTCEISHSNNPHYVVAYIRDYHPGRGCYSNSSSRSHQHVHVISLKLRDHHGSVKSRRNVVLKIEPKNFQDLQDSISSTKDVKDLQLHEHQVAFILNSQHPVNWQIETSMKFQPHTRQRFFIPRHSTIRFKKRRTRVLMRKRHKAMPSPSDEHNFLKWVRTHFGAVTSYSEVDGDRLLFFVGQAEGTSSECLLNAMMPSPFAFIADMERQKNVKGCVASGMHSVLERPVYIIELEDIPQNVVMSPDRQVELDIMPADSKKVEHDFYLVLRSPHNVKWILRSHRVQGWIDVVTDADVDLRGIRMHTVALRREEMAASGVDLIRWVDYYIAYVRAYTLVSSANVVHLLLPSDSSKANTNHLQSGQNHAGMPTREGNPPNRHSTDMREELKNIIKTRCDNNVMEVTLPTLLTQELDLSVEQLSLLDGSCRATKNRTDVILRTDLDKCRTSKITVDDTDVYSNAIVIHASGVVGALLEEELGSGYFDLQATSGSGWSEANGEGSVTTYIDDEDFTAHKVEIDVQCRVPRASVTTGSEEQSTRSSGLTSGCAISVYTDPFLVQKVSSFPLTVSSFQGVYIINSAPADWQLHVLLDSCWVSRWSNPFRSDPDQIDLVHNGCLRSPNVDWFRPAKFFKQVQYSPSGLVINRVLSHGSYLHCQLSTCHEETGSAEQKCPPEPADRCNSGVLPNVFPRLDTKTCGVYTVGPLEITASDIQLMPDSDQTSKPFSITSSRSSTAGRGQEGQGQLSHQSQQSVVIEGLDSGTVVGIAFAAFAIGILLTGALWFIHTHTSPTKRGMSSMGAVSGDVTPNSSSPISA